MKPYIDAFLKWLRSVYSESDGSGSSTRVHMTEFILFTLIVGLAFAIGTLIGKFTIEQFCAFLAASGAFVITTCGPLYGANSFLNWGLDKNGKKPDANTANTNPPGQPGQTGQTGPGADTTK